MKVKYMTREEEIINQSHKYRLSNLSKNKDFTYNGTDLEEAYESGAKWADEHPHTPTREEILKELRVHAEYTERFYNLMGQIPHIEQLAILQMEEDRKQTIEKACEWLWKNISNYQNWEYNEFHQCVEYDGSVDIEKMINDFKKAMEE